MDWLGQLIERYPVLSVCEENILSAFQSLVALFSNGGKLLICGNGGSASDADHIAGELLKSFCNPRKLSGAITEGLSEEALTKLQNALPAIPLANLTGLVSAYSNDCDPQWVFAQLTWALGVSKDGLFCLSTSGKSKNVLKAAEVARAKNMQVIAMTGKGGGDLKALSDVCICVPENETFKVQELHLPIYHCLCLMLEAHFFPIASK